MSSTCRLSSAFRQSWRHMVMRAAEPVRSSRTDPRSARPALANSGSSRNARGVGRSMASSRCGPALGDRRIRLKKMPWSISWPSLPDCGRDRSAASWPSPGTSPGNAVAAAAASSASRRYRWPPPVSSVYTPSAWTSMNRARRARARSFQASASSRCSGDRDAGSGSVARMSPTRAAYLLTTTRASARRAPISGTPSPRSAVTSAVVIASDPPLPAGARDRRPRGVRPARPRNWRQVLPASAAA